MKKICFDVDGVLADFDGAFMPHMNKVLGTDVRAIPTTWSWCDLGVSGEQVSAAWREWRKVNNVWTMLQPLPDAYILAEHVHQHLLDDVELWFVTSRVPSAGDSVLQQTKDWLFWNVGIDSANVIVVRHSSFKADVVKALAVTHSIDDFPPTVTALNHQHGHKAYLMLRPWNEYEQKAYDLPFVRNMEEFLERVRA